MGQVKATPTMTSQTIDRPASFAPHPIGNHTTQATQVEQARAIAEVQAAVVVAQQCPRDMTRAEGEMRDACGRLALANRAFYRVPNRGSGPSVHLARELARVWGNVQYGVHELRRDDAAGMSEIQAFAWDVQTNTRSTRTFQVPHQRMFKGERKALVDLGDVYLNNQNIGARAVRECIFTVLPTWFTETAEGLCRATLQNGDGQPIEARIEQGVSLFASTYGIKQAQLEEKIGRKRGQWDAGDVASLQVLFMSLQRGEVAVSEEFPEQRMTAGDFIQTDAGAAEPPQDNHPGPASEASDDGVRSAVPAPASPKITPTQQRKLFALFKAKGIAEDEQLPGIAHVIGRPIESRTAMTPDEFEAVVKQLEARPDALREDAEGGEQE